MNILFVSNLYPPNVVGGYERLCAEVAGEMAARGHRVAVLTSDFGGKLADYPGQTIHRTMRLLTGENIYQPFALGDAERERTNRGNIAAMEVALAGSRPEVIFCWNLFFLDHSLLDALVASGIPLLVMLTDNWLVNLRQPLFVAHYFRDHVFGDLPFPPGLSLMERVKRRFAPPLPFAALFGAAFMQVFYHAAGFRFAGEHVVHNGVRQQQRPDAAFRDRTRFVAPGALRLLFAGRLVDLKGAHTAIAALPLLNDMALGAVRLTIVGDTQDAPYQERLQAEIGRTGTAAQIDFRDMVPEDALFALFQSHDIYLFPSLYEPFSLTLILALANGIPTVASDAGGNPEIIRDGETGVIFHRGDAVGLAQGVARLARDPALRQGIAARGRAAAANFTFERMVGEAEAILLSLAAKR